MAYVPGFQNDIYISYSHVDNARAESGDRYITHLHQRLETELSQLAGNLVIWRDSRLASNALFDDTIWQAIENSALFIAVNSIGYLQSDYCRKELEWFIHWADEDSYGRNIGDRSRVIHLHLRNIPRTDWPVEFQGMQGYEFFEKTKDGEIAPPLKLGSAKFKNAVQRLAGGLFNTLRAFRQAVERKPEIPPLYAVTRQQYSPLTDAYDRLVHFARRFGEPHVTLAMHAAVPLGLTPELVHFLRIYFAKAAPQIAEADLLLSPLCREVGGGAYEMYPEVRDLLLAELQEDEAFGAARIHQVAEFLMVFATRQLRAERHPESRNFLVAQQWAAFAQRQPGEAARELAAALRTRLSAQNPTGSLRLAQLARTLNAPLMGQDNVLLYAAGVESLALGDTTRAQDVFGVFGSLQQKLRVQSIPMPALPELVQLWPSGKENIQTNDLKLAQSNNAEDRDNSYDTATTKNTKTPKLPINWAGAHVFISYKRTTGLDEPLAREVYKQLSRYCEVFIDQRITVGVDWSREIEEQLKRSDYMIVFLSRNSVQSEMVTGEVEMAKRLAEKQNGKPKILPVRVAFHDSLPFPLSAYLDPIPYALWETETDTPRLLAELAKAILDQAALLSPAMTPSDLTDEMPFPKVSAQPRKLDLSKVDSPRGTIEPDSAFYIVRDSDYIAHNAIQRKGVTITIKGPHQIGKSSLLIRTMEAAVAAGKRAVFLDYQLIENEALSDADRFYRRFCEWVTDELEMESRVAEYWASPLSNNQRCTRYFSRYLLKELNQPLVLAMDEVERLFAMNFCSDFFSMLRNWHNSRANPATPVWNQLDLVLVTSTEPYLLIEDLNQSPFNVGEVINPDDFTREQVNDLNERYGAPLDYNEAQHLMQLLNGHPYLTRRALYLIATDQLTVKDLFAKATNERGPFGDHLRLQLFQIHNKPWLIKGMCSAMKQNTCDDESTFLLLRGAGLVKRGGMKVEPRCQLYADFFREHLNCS
jgi:hypothetical protein